MGVSVAIEENLIVFRLEGQNTRLEAEAAFREVFSRDDVPGKPNILVDARTSRRNRPVNEAASLAEALGNFRGQMGARCALLLSFDRPDQLRLERYLATFSVRYELQFFLFHEESDARTWLSEAVPQPSHLEPQPDPAEDG